MISIISKSYSIDSSIKYLFSSSIGRPFECILFSLEREPGKSIICLSTQSGCNMHCDFCETGKMECCFNLSALDMFNALECILSENPNANVKWVSLMGMGEPLLNYENISKFYYLVKEKYELTLSLSTCGISPKIIDLADSDLKYHLFVSLHFCNEENRSKYMPINKKYNIKSIFEACEYYHQKRPNEKIEISYLMFESINISKPDLDTLIRLTNKEYYLVQLLFYNAGNDHNGLYKRISFERANEINKYLREHSVNSYLSISAGRDIGGACGQMAAIIK